jgi:chromosome segregation ATPase
VKKLPPQIDTKSQGYKAASPNPADQVSHGSYAFSKYEDLVKQQQAISIEE